MRDTALRSILVATTALLLITGTTAAQEIGAIFDPLPTVDGFFEYTMDDWKFKGSIENERLHVFAAVYGVEAPEMLARHLENEFGLCTQSN